MRARTVKKMAKAQRRMDCFLLAKLFVEVRSQVVQRQTNMAREVDSRAAAQKRYPAMARMSAVWAHIAITKARMGRKPGIGRP